MKRKISLTGSTILLCSLLIITPVLFSVVHIGRLVSKQLQTVAKETASFYMEQYIKETNLTIDTLKSCIQYLTIDSNTQEIMNSSEAPSQLERLKTEEGLGKALMLGRFPDSNTVTGIYLVKDNLQYLSVIRNGAFSGTYRRILDISKSLGEKNSARDLYLSPDYPNYCYFIVDYIDLNTTKPLGKIIIEIDSKRLLDISAVTSIYAGAKAKLRSDSGELIAQTEDIPSLLDVPLSPNGGYITMEEESYYHHSKALSPNNIQLDLLIPKKEILKSIDTTLGFSILFTCTILLLTLFLGSFILYLLFKPVKQMLKNLDAIAEGNLSVRMAPTPYWETSQMADTYNDMADRLNELFEEVYLKGILLHDAEFRLLESQIRPHFIFNILELINMRCMEAKEYDICKIVVNLADLLRANITHKHQQTITMEHELNYVRYYLELQKERFGNKLEYSIELEDTDILKCFLPKLTIQPLVENSIVHGLENKREGGFVKISIWEEECGFCVRILDNGIGFDTNDLNLDTEIDSKIDSSSHNHIALCNINRRIQLLYGKDYGLNIESTIGEGTSILLTIPVITTPQEGGKINHVQSYDRG